MVRQLSVVSKLDSKAKRFVLKCRPASLLSCPRCQQQPRRTTLVQNGIYQWYLFNIQRQCLRELVIPLQHCHFASKTM